MKGMPKKHLWGLVILFWTLLFLITISTAHAGKAWAQKSGPVDLTTAIADVAQKAMPAVVHIEVTQRVDVPTPVFPFESDPFFRYFFGVPQGPRSYKREMRGIGTGMTIDGDGYIVTNNHVVSGAIKITVKMASGEEFKAKVVGVDPKTDLAVIKIKAPQNIPYLTFGNSDQLRVGEWVVAIGNPRGLEQTVTAGIISAKHRTGILDPSSYQDYIQTDAAINPGNSGGPLLNLAGEVIGVNAAIVSESGGFEGIGFAIPSNMAKAIADDLIKTGKVMRGWLGVSVQDITAPLAKSLNLKVLKGAWIAEVFKGGPAEKAGIMKGDVVVSYDGAALENANDFRNRVAATRAGKKVEVGLLRQGERVTIQAVVSAYKPSPRMAADKLKNKLGVEVKEISILEARRQRLGSREGVILTKVDPHGPAGRAGLEAGDIILQVNNQAVRGINDYNRILEQVQRDEEILLLVRDMRTGDMGYLAVVVQ
ncbi:MAG: DegQ family serine endoprotease [Proteobacteria bacterium]|nr:DegQ family serine endoprotease [Pseudomonadota bacterium]